MQQLAKVLSTVASRLEAKEAAASLDQVISKMKDPVTLGILAQGLAAVGSRLEPTEATATLTEAMSNTTEPGALQHLSQRLSTVALPPGAKGVR